VRSAIRWPLLGPLVVLLGLATLLSAAAPARAAPPVASIEMDSAITPVTVRLLITALDRAQSEGAQALIVQLHPPGGL
jgi:membrane-bound ClpP family serine protease